MTALIVNIQIMQEIIFISQDNVCTIDIFNNFCFRSKYRLNQLFAFLMFYYLPRSARNPSRNPPTGQITIDAIVDKLNANVYLFATMANFYLRDAP